MSTTEWVLVSIIGIIIFVIIIIIAIAAISARGAGTEKNKDAPSKKTVWWKAGLITTGLLIIVVVIYSYWGSFTAWVSSWFSPQTVDKATGEIVEDGSEGFSLQTIEDAPGVVWEWITMYTNTFFILVAVVVIMLFIASRFRPKKNQKAGGSSDWGGTLIVLAILLPVGYAIFAALSGAMSFFGVWDDVAVAVHGPKAEKAEERRLSRQAYEAPVPTATESACGTAFAAVKDCKRIAFRNGGTFDYRALTGHCPGYDRKNALNITPIEDGFTHAYSSRYPNRETVVHFYSLKPGQAFLGYTCPS